MKTDLTREPQLERPSRLAETLAGDVAKSAAGADQTASDSDQTSSDSDQTASERDEADAASDQVASDRDEAASQEQRRLTSNRHVQERFEASSVAREQNTVSRLFRQVDRSRTTRQRTDTAARRDATAAKRDETSAHRDAHTDSLEDRDLKSAGPLASKLERVQARAKADRARAASDRARAAADRLRATEDRAQAAKDRARLETELHSAHLDDLTGAYRREMGRRALGHEIDRAVRADGRFVIAFVDVDGMKRLNDVEGHAAGDNVLKTLVWTMKSNLRSFDPVVRYGGDEFVCGIGGVDREEVERRFEAISRAVEEGVGVGISVGLAELEPDDTLDRLTPPGQTRPS
jgi:diguanylate cyclase (GGDEF)-like protein